ncbi:MAG TPA: hypothetical protein GX392_02615 [Clostridiales bacterium]|nr:hypothetical protein [Clostridiales bacterium]
MFLRKIMRIFLLLLIFIFILVSCAYTQDDWTDFINYDDIQYVRNYENEERGVPLTPDDIDKEYFEIKRKLAGGMNNVGYVSKSGDAAYLDEGTQIYTVKGYNPDFRVAAFHDGDIILYEAYTNKWAQKGSELLDIEDKVESISIIENREDDYKELAEIEDEATVEKLVDMILEAPIDHDEGVGKEQYYLLIFHLKDGTVSSRYYDISGGILATGIKLPDKFREIIEQACEKQK